MNNILTIKVFGDVEHKYGPYIRIGYRDKEAAFNLLDKDRRPLTNEAIAKEIYGAKAYVHYWAGHKEIDHWEQLCRSARDLYVEMRKDDE